MPPRASSATRYYHLDGLGSTRVLTNSSQTATDTYLNDAWGVPVVALGSTTNPFRWVGGPGYYFDTETGLFYVRARSYSSSLARWLSQDPLYVKPQRRQLRTVAMNLYMYSVASPTFLFDPSGLRCTVCAAEVFDNEKLSDLDKYVLGNPFSKIGHAAIDGYSAGGIFQFPEITNAGLQIGTYIGPDAPKGSFVKTGYLIFVAALVREDKPRDCELYLDETGSSLSETINNVSTTIVDGKNQGQIEWTKNDVKPNPYGMRPTTRDKGIPIKSLSQN